MAKISWSTTNDGPPITEQDLGSGANGSTFETVTVWISHDQASPLTGCQIYLKPTPSTYEGDAASTEADLDELLAWGDSTVDADYGGVQISFVEGQWPTDMIKSVADPEDATRTLALTVRTGYADDETTAIDIPVEAIEDGVEDGSIPATKSASFQIQVKVPDSEDTLGKRHFAIELVHD